MNLLTRDGKMEMDIKMSRYPIGNKLFIATRNKIIK